MAGQNGGSGAARYARHSLTVRLLLIGTVVAVLAMGAMYLVQKWKRDAEDRAAWEAANAATELPPGFREAWMKSLQAALEAQLVLQGGRLRFPGFMNGVTWAPISQVAATCSPLFGIYLTYGQGDDAEELVILGTQLSSDGTDFPMPEFGPDVGNMSPAVARLMDETCAAISTVLKNQGR